LSIEAERRLNPERNREGTMRTIGEKMVVSLFASALVILSGVMSAQVVFAGSDAKAGAVPPAKQEIKSGTEDFPFFADSSWLKEIARLQAEMNRMFDEHFKNFLGERNELIHVNTDVVEKPDRIIVTCDMPGMSKQDIKVNVKNNILTIKGERKTEKDISENGEKGKNIVAKERSFGSFSRSILLPKGVKAGEIKAGYKDGVLEVVIPREKVEKSEDTVTVPVN
jgi:HSP20 family protein